MLEKKLSDKMSFLRADRPNEWQMDEFIRDAKNLETALEHARDEFLQREIDRLREDATEAEMETLPRQISNRLAILRGHKRPSIHANLIAALAYLKEQK